LLSLKINQTIYDVTAFGATAFILKPKSQPLLKIPFIGQQILDANIKGLRDVIATNHDLTIFCKEKKLHKILQKIELIKWENAPSPQTWKLPVFFDNLEDWKHVEQEVKLSKDLYIPKLLQQKIEIGMYGFIPGFIYMNGLDKQLQCPRKSTPSPNPYGGVLALGGPYVGIHCLASPTGWNVIGRIPLKILDINQLPPVAMRAGDQIQIESINKKEFEILNRIKENIISYNGLV